MVPESQIKLVCIVIVSTSLASYVILTELFPSSSSIFGVTLSANLLFAGKFASYIVSIFAGILAIRSQNIAKLVYRNSFIGGRYEGVSRWIDSDNKEVEVHTEKMTIIQNLITLKVSGESFDKNGEYHGKYDGLQTIQVHHSFKTYYRQENIKATFTMFHV